MKETLIIGTFPIQYLAKIVVKLNVDSEGTLTASAYEASTSRNASVQLIECNKLADSEISLMKAEAESFEKEDFIMVQAIMIRNQADKMIYAAKKHLLMKVSLSGKEEHEFHNLIDDLKLVRDNTDNDLVLAKMDQI